MATNNATNFPNNPAKIISSVGDLVTIYDVNDGIIKQTTAGAIANLSGGGGLSLLGSGSAVNQSTVSVNNIIPNTIDCIQIIYSNVLFNTAGNETLYMQVGYGAGPTYITSGYNTYCLAGNSTTYFYTLAGNSTTKFTLSIDLAGVFNRLKGGSFNLYGLNSSNIVNGQGQDCYTNPSLKVNNTYGFGTVSIPSPITSVQFFGPAGYIMTTGDFYIYGLTT